MNGDEKEPRGLYQKYRLAKADGTPTDPEANYFVMRLDTDVHAQEAALTYARSVQGTNRELALDLMELIAINQARLKADFSVFRGLEVTVSIPVEGEQFAGMLERLTPRELKAVIESANIALQAVHDMTLVGIDGDGAVVFDSIHKAGDDGQF